MGQFTERKVRQVSGLSDRRYMAVPFMQAALVLLAGAILALLVGNAPPLIAAGAVVVILFLVLFLQRPAYGLLVVLLARASTDASFMLLGMVVGGGTILGALPNIVLISVVIVAGGIFILARGVPLLRLPGGRLLALFLVGGLIASLRADSATLALNDWLPVLAGFIIYALAAELFKTPEAIQTLLDTVTVSFLLPAVFGFYQLVRGTGSYMTDVGQTRVFGTFVHSNPFAFYLVIVLTLFLVQSLGQKGKRRGIAALGAVAAVVLLLATFTRVAWAGALLAVLVLGAFRHRIILLVVPIVAILAFALVPPLAGRLADPFGGSFQDRLTNLWPANINEWRAATASEGSAVVIAVSRLLGLGPGMGQILSRRGGYFFSTPPHNDYLRVLVEYGIFGLALFIGLLTVMVVFAFKTFRAAVGVDPFLGQVALAFLALSLAFPIMSLTDNVFGYTANQVYYWALAGITVAIHRLATASLSERDFKGRPRLDG